MIDAHRNWAEFLQISEAISLRRVEELLHFQLHPPLVGPYARAWLSLKLRSVVGEQGEVLAQADYVDML